MQPAPPPPQPPPGYAPIYVEQPAPAAPVAKTAGRHRHDGFYFRASIGVGGLNTDLEYQLASAGRSTVKGGGGALDLLIGGTPMPGFVIGGGLLINGAGNAQVETSFPNGTKRTSEQNASFSMLGIFVDAFPNPSGGFHFGGLFGASGFTLDDAFANDRNSSGSNGWGAAGWVGYGGWISSEWSLGGMARVSGGITNSTFDMPIQNTSTSVDEHASSKTFSVLFTVLYH